MWKFLAGVVAAGVAAYGLIYAGLLDLDFSPGADRGAAPAEGAAGEGGGPWLGAADEIRAHIEFLADDLLEGREAGARGYDIAALYAARHFASLGLAPAGDDGSFLQTVPLLWIESDRSGAAMSLARDGREIALVQGQDFSIGGSAAHEESRVTAPLVFAGFGLDAPAFGIDSYANIDAEGKIVVVLIGAPPTLPAEERAHYGSTATKAALAASKGAVGMIAIYTPAFENVISFPLAVELGARASMTWIAPDGSAHESFPEIQASALMNPASTEILFEGAEMSYADVRAAAAEGDAPSFDLIGEVSLAQRTRHERQTSPNVVAMLEGGDAALRDEYVVYTAHLDHDGYGREIDGDNLYNGAVDNASGSAVVMDVARAFARSQARPRRSIIFLLVTAEEKGLRGAGYFAHFPTVPIERIVANVNIDGVLGSYDFADVIAFGDAHSTLRAHLEQAAGAMGLGVMPDPFPEQGFFTRSDHYRFVQQGVPAVFTLMGFTATDGSNAGQLAIQDYLANRYHQPDDDLTYPFDYDAMAKFVEFQYRLGRSIADADERPLWNEGDFFGELFSRD